MIQVRESSSRGAVDLGWLKSQHSFSFGGYFDPKFMGFRDLRVINEDFVAGAKGFEPHSHHNMEIFTYILEGALEHKDSMGTGSVIKPGDVQRMSAGTGVEHSEFNHSKTEKVHLLQIWLFPDQKGLAPSYEQKSFSRPEKENALCLILSKEGQGKSLKIHQDVLIYSSLLQKDKEVSLDLKGGRAAWIQMASGSVLLNGTLLKEGDGCAVTEEKHLSIVGQSNESEFLLFDLK